MSTTYIHCPVCDFDGVRLIDGRMEKHRMLIDVYDDSGTMFHGLSTCPGSNRAIGGEVVLLDSHRIRRALRAAAIAQRGEQQNG